MAAINFPTPAAVGEAFTADNGVTYTWNGTLWLASGASAGGDFMAKNSTNVVLGGTLAVVILNTVYAGNAGGWYSTSTGRYTPPAGRYAIYGMLSGFAGAASEMTFELRKNGSATYVARSIETASAANYYTSISVSALVDANGTDYFELWANGASTPSVPNATFTAYPISGIKGPPGDLPNGLKLYSEHELVSVETQLQVSIPSTWKSLRLEYVIRCSTSADFTPRWQGTLAGVPFATANHTTLTNSYSNNITGSGAPSGSSTFGGTVFLLSNSIQSHGTIDVFLMPFQSTLAAVAHSHAFSTVGTRFNTVLSYEGSAKPPGIDAIRIYDPGAGLSFAIGSWLRCYAVV